MAIILYYTDLCPLGWLYTSVWSIFTALWVFKVTGITSCDISVGVATHRMGEVAGLYVTLVAQQVGRGPEGRSLGTTILMTPTFAVFRHTVERRLNGCAFDGVPRPAVRPQEGDLARTARAVTNRATQFVVE